MQVYKKDKDGFYLEPVILSPEYVEERIPYKPSDEVIEGDVSGDTGLPITPPSPSLTIDLEDMELVTEGEEQFYVYLKEQYTVPEDCVTVAPPSFYKPKWVTNKWVEAGTQPVTPEAPPTVDEKVESLEQQVADLMFMMMTGGN